MYVPAEERIAGHTPGRSACENVQEGPPGAKLKSGLAHRLEGAQANQEIGEGMMLWVVLHKAGFHLLRCSSKPMRSGSASFQQSVPCATDVNGF